MKALHSLFMSVIKHNMPLDGGWWAGLLRIAVLYSIIMMAPQPIILVVWHGVHITQLMSPLTLLTHNMRTPVHTAIFPPKLARERFLCQSTSGLGCFRFQLLTSLIHSSKNV